MIKECRQPPSLRKGDTIGIFCPAGPAKNAELVQCGIELLQNAGFLVQCEGQIFPLNSSHSGYLSDSDASRAAALHRLWTNEKVKAILAVRGGYGCLRILPLLDRKLLSGQAKWLAGFSDVTILLNFLSCHCGIASLHGPVLSSFMRGDQEDNFRKKYPCRTSKSCRVVQQRVVLLAVIWRVSCIFWGLPGMCPGIIAFFFSKIPVNICTVLTAC